MIVDINIKAKCIQESDNSCSFLEHDLEFGKMYDVQRIEMGQSYTDIFINNKCYNSVYFEFYVGNQKIDIYRSSLFNPYMKQAIDNLIVKKEDEQ